MAAIQYYDVILKPVITEKSMRKRKLLPMGRKLQRQRKVLRQEKLPRRKKLRRRSKKLPGK